MPKLGAWWAFLAVFALVIAGLLTLTGRTRPVRAAVGAPTPASAALRQLQCQPKHWRALVMQQ